MLGINSNFSACTGHLFTYFGFSLISALLCLTTEKIPGDNHLPPGIKCKRAENEPNLWSWGLSLLPVFLQWPEGGYGKPTRAALHTVCFGICAGAWLECARLENCLWSSKSVC